VPLHFPSDLALPLLPRQTNCRPIGRARVHGAVQQGQKLAMSKQKEAGQQGTVGDADSGGVSLSVHMPTGGTVVHGMAELSP
jgi:hypothetical protein